MEFSIQIVAYIIGGIALLLMILSLLVCVVRQAWTKVQQWHTAWRRARLVHHLNRIQIKPWSDELAVSDTCAVCTSTFINQEEIVFLTCNHGFHFRCVEDRVIAANLTCPQCNADMIPNARRYRTSDLLDPECENTPLIREAFYRPMHVGRRRHLSVLSDVSETTSPGGSPAVLATRRRPSSTLYSNGAHNGSSSQAAPSQSSQTDLNRSKASPESTQLTSNPGPAPSGGPSLESDERPPSVFSVSASTMTSSIDMDGRMRYLDALLLRALPLPSIDPRRLSLPIVPSVPALTQEELQFVFDPVPFRKSN